MHLTPRTRTLLALLLGAGLQGTSLAADAPESPEQAQAKALAPLAAFDGTWRGPARTLARNGKFLDLVQTERVGPMLGGAIRLVEGRGHAQDGSVQFNALGIFSYNPREKRYSFHSYAQGHEGDFPLTVQADGFTWELAAGPARIRYTAKVQGDEWTELGERLMEGQPPMVIFEMRLRRVGPTGWPAEGALGPK
jgi:hypothetical protein